MVDKFVIRTPPRWAIYKGRRVRVTEYDRDYITVVLWNDTVTQVHRKHLVFVKE